MNLNPEKKLLKSGFSHDTNPHHPVLLQHNSECGNSENGDILQRLRRLICFACSYRTPLSTNHEALHMATGLLGKETLQIFVEIIPFLKSSCFCVDLLRMSL